MSRVPPPQFRRQQHHLQDSTRIKTTRFYGPNYEETSDSHSGGYYQQIVQQSDDDASTTCLPYYEFQDDSSRPSRSSRRYQRTKVHPGGHLEPSTTWEVLYQEIPENQIPAPPRRQDSRPLSSMSSGSTSLMVHGCGGKCKTFENICYFFLQLVFTMGILVGVSLCIAGVVLRKSAARNLQVLVYIGGLLALVSTLLLGIQCNARNSARKRRKQALKRPVELEQFRVPPPPPLNRIPPPPIITFPQIHGPIQPRPLSYQEDLMEQQGVPWWRRKDII